MTQETEPRIDVKEAIAKARSTLTEVFADRKFDRLLLEEVELSDDENRWIITFGFDEFIPADRRAKPRGITALATFDYEPPIEMEKKSLSRL